MSPTTLLLIFAAACSSLVLVSSRKITVEREALIESAIAEVKHEFSKERLSTLQAKEQVYSRKASKATKEGIAQGLASMKFERMVKVAEKKILRSQRLATVQTKSSMAEALAAEIMHKPGSILSAQEIARIYEESECAEVLPAPDCSSPEVLYHRTPDGSCNNLANPTLGAAGTPLRRLIPARYDDGVSRPRGFLQNQDSELFSGPFRAPLPSPRVARTSIIEDRIINDSIHTHMLMQWGQFMDHDLDLVVVFEDCPEGCEISEEDEGRCYPFPVPLSDEDVMVTRTDEESRGCHEFRRSLGACPPPGLDKLPLREQVNVLTHFIDGSMVYGHSEAIFDEIRDLDSPDGLLRTGPPATDGSQRPLLPDAVSTSFVDCPEGSEPPPCFVAGDFRVVEQAGLTVMHTVWVREHNRIALELRQLGPGLTSDQIFFTTRQIVASIIQKITYQDFIPILIGDDIDELIPPYMGYDDTVDPGVPNAFATAAYRFGHSQIQPFFDRLDENYESIPAGPLPLVFAFFNTTHVRDFGITSMVRGLVEKPAREVDEFINSILTNQLFADSATSPGMDLAALNIQRGRDHGIPPYLIWKQWAKDQCDVESDFRNELTEVHLYQTYGSLDSVDLFVGGLAEAPLPGGLVGAVFGCIFAHTFKNLRDGDRFYYENDGDTAPLTEEQIAEINIATLSRVLCDNTDITEIQPDAFFVGPREPCEDLPEVDLSVFVPGAPATTPPPPPPGLCSIRIGTGVNFTTLVVSSNNQDPDLVVEQTNGDGCIPVLCPVGEGVTRIGVFSSCPVFPPPSVIGDSDSPAFFQADFTSDAFDGQNGLFNGMSGPNCLASSVNALEYCVDSAGAASASVDLVRKLAGNAFVQAMFGDSATSDEDKMVQSAASDDNLVSLMEDVLEKMKGSSHEEQKKAAAEESDSALISKLEKVLQKLK